MNRICVICEMLIGYFLNSTKKIILHKAPFMPSGVAGGALMYMDQVTNKILPGAQVIILSFFFSNQLNKNNNRQFDCV